jgi:outer membrane protein assembly factor BamE (lipoprotein component of BamABCDE complex)|tara:strand:+ start:93 stop:524 length:432 start_codon:yes stop_codon:yes gene_type:complete
MNNHKKILLIIFTFLFTSNCSEKIVYSGTILNNEFDYLSLSNKKAVVSNLGKANYIDIIENKYFYYSEKKIIKNNFNKKTIQRNVIVYKFDESENVIFSKLYDLNKEQEIKIIKEQTKNNLIKRGFLEKVFGGVGKQTLPNTQ